MYEMIIDFRKLKFRDDRFFSISFYPIATMVF